MFRWRCVRHSFQIIIANKIVNDDKSRQRQSRFCLQYLEYPPECDRGWGKVAAVINWYQTQPSWNYNFHLQTGARHQLITWRSSVQVIANCKIAKILTVVTVAIYLFVANIFIYILFFMVGPSQACQAKRLSAGSTTKLWKPDMLIGQKQFWYLEIRRDQSSDYPPW